MSRPVPFNPSAARRRELAGLHSIAAKASHRAELASYAEFGGWLALAIACGTILGAVL